MGNGARPEAVVLQGRLALVTGAGQGIGRAIAIGLADAGAAVIVTDLVIDKAKETAQTVRFRGGLGWGFQLDVTCAADCAKLSATIATDIGKVDLLVNNAGILIRQDSDSPNAAQNWARTFDVNVNGTFNVTQAFLAMLRETRGTIVNLASIASYVGQSGPLGYSASKGAVKLYTQSLAAELAPDGVRVNAVAPGLIETAMNESARRNLDYVESFLRRTPLGRAGRPQDLVGPIVFLSSKMSEYVTGVTLPVDGGFLAV